MIYGAIWAIIVCQRITEMIIAKRNERWMKEQGGKVIHERIYHWIVLTHILFLVAIITEGGLNGYFSLPIQPLYLFLFLLLQFFRFCCLFSLGKFWNTKVIVMENVTRIKKGPYKYFRHPNYFVVGVEFIVIPLLFHSYLTAVIFPILHIILMRYRIPVEEEALGRIKETT